jgi:hypothetical protein
MKGKKYLLVFVINIILCSYNFKTTPLDLVKEFLSTVQERNFDKAKKYVDGNFSDSIILEMSRLWKINPKSFKDKNNYTFNLIKSTDIDALISVSDEYNNINITLRKKNEEWKIILKSAAIIDLLRGNTREEDASPDDYVLELGDIQEEQIINKNYSGKDKISDKIINRDISQKKDEANVFYKSHYTLFDLYTDEPIFPDSKGIYHIYYASNEEKFPRKISITAKELESFGFYKFKNLENCSKWCSESKQKDTENKKIINSIKLSSSDFDTLSKTIRYTANELPNKLILKDENYTYLEKLKEVSGKVYLKDKVYLYKDKPFTGKALIFDNNSFYKKYKYNATLSDSLISNFKVLDNNKHVLLFNSNKDTLPLSGIFLIKDGKVIGEIVYDTNTGNVGYAKYRETTNSKKFTKYIFFQDGTLKEKSDVTYEMFLNYEHEIRKGDFVEYFEDGSIKAIGFLGGNTPGLAYYTTEEYYKVNGKNELGVRKTYPGIYRRGRPNFEVDFIEELYSKGKLYRRIIWENEINKESHDYFPNGKVYTWHKEQQLIKEFDSSGTLVKHYDINGKSLMKTSSSESSSSTPNVYKSDVSSSSKDSEFVKAFRETLDFMVNSTFNPVKADKCLNCRGTGIVKVCTICSKRGRVHCRNCNGTGYDSNFRVCLNCSGKGITTCHACNGKIYNIKCQHSIWQFQR